MNSSEVLTIEETGKVILPNDIAERRHFTRESQFRIIETQNGVLLIPLTAIADEQRVGKRNCRLAVLGNGKLGKL